MLGLCAMMFAFLVLISLIFYWISWEVRHKEKRPTFTKKVWNDLVAHFEIVGGFVRKAGLRLVAGRSGRVVQTSRRQSLEAPARSARRTANWS
jgi:hypothetical protein